MMQFLEHLLVRQQAGEANVRFDAGRARAGLEGVALCAVADNGQVHRHVAFAHHQAHRVDQMGKPFFGTEAADRDQAKDAIGAIHAVGADGELAQIKTHRQNPHALGRASARDRVVPRVVRVREYDIGAPKRRADGLGIEPPRRLAAVVIEGDPRVGIDATNRGQVSRRRQVVDQAQVGRVGRQQHALCCLNDPGTQLGAVGSRDGGPQSTRVPDQRARQGRLHVGERVAARGEIRRALGQPKAARWRVADVAPRSEREDGQRMAFEHELPKLCVEIGLERIGIVLREGVDSTAASRRDGRGARDLGMLVYAG